MMEIKLTQGFTQAAKNKAVLGCGAELKNTFCIAAKGTAFLSRQFGDLKDGGTFGLYRKEIQKNILELKISPGLIVHDLHPDYLSTRYALGFAGKGVKVIGVQHHFAHTLSCMADNGLSGRVIGVSFDGTGYGSDGNMWGGEFLVAGYRDFKRACHLKYIPAPGADKAALEPWRMALSYITDAFSGEECARDIPFLKKLDKKKAGIVRQMLKERINCPLTSSAGRLFDAVSAMLGICGVCSYEAQAAVELQKAAEKAIKNVKLKIKNYGYKIIEKDSNAFIDTGQMIRDIIKDIKDKEPVEEIAYRFHYTVADIILNACRRIRKSTGLKRVALSGGVFLNKLLLNMAIELLRKNSFAVFTHSRAPTGDSGISLGQAVYGLMQ